MANVRREYYISKLFSTKDVNLIKVLTGIRRCGKSTIFEQYIHSLKNEGIALNNVQHYNFEKFENENLKNRKALTEVILSKLVKNEKNYIFLDEIQEVEEFEILCDHLFMIDNIDLYLTGSNSRFLSSEIATILAGRYIEIHVLPFSFKEFYTSFENKDKQECFNMYLQLGSFPEVRNLIDSSESSIGLYLESIYNSVIEGDIFRRNQVRNKIAFRNLIEFILDSTGKIVSPKNISNQFREEKTVIDVSSISNYLSYLTDSFFFYNVKRYDIKGKKLLKTLEKLYCVDTGLRQLLLGRFQGKDTERLIENIVYLELLRRFKNVRIGKVDDLEIDFIAQNNDGITNYFQVSLSVRNNETLERELKPFRKTKDKNPSFLLTLDHEEPQHDGVRQLNIVNWLLS